MHEDGAVGPSRRMGGAKRYPSTSVRPDDGFRFEAGQESWAYAAVLKRKQMIGEFRLKLTEKRFMEAVARLIADMTARRTHKIDLSAKIALWATRLAKNVTNSSKPRMFSVRARL